MPTAREQVGAIVDGLIKQGTIPASERDNYLTSLAGDEARAQVFAGMLMRGDDYTRKTQEVARQRQEVEAERQRQAAELARRQQGLEEWERTARRELEEARSLQSTVPGMAAKVAAYEQALRDYNLLDQVQVPNVATPAPSQVPSHTPAQTPAQQGDWLKRDEATNYMRQLVELQGESMLIASRHQSLFGKPIDRNIISESLQANVPLEQYWRTLYNVEAREAELQANEREAERARIREEERAKLMSEFVQTPGQPPVYVGKTPELFNVYNPSKALATETTAPAPEMRPDLSSAMSRVNDAASFFRQNFTPEGSPRNGGGPAGEA